MNAPVRFFARGLLIGLLVSGVTSNCMAYSFHDNFDDGVIDPAFWIASGDGISESGGTLNLSRNSNADSIRSIGSFSGHFDITFDILLKDIVWNDAFHGITLSSSTNHGISFGFSMYRQFYSAEHRPNGESFYYTGTSLDPPAFVVNRWYSFRLVGNTGETVDLYVDGTRLFTRNLGSVPDFSILLPGTYNDGDGPGIGDSDTTDSRIDSFHLDIAAVPIITEFGTGISPGARPAGITTGPDGNLWFTEFAGRRIGRMVVLPGNGIVGEVTEFTQGITAGDFLTDITAGPDGNVWYILNVGGRIGRITPQGVATEFDVGYHNMHLPTGITAGPDGNLWFTESSGNRIGRITPLGVITEFSAGITAGAQPAGIAAGPDGNLWFTEYGGDRIGRITPQGNVTEFAAGITAGATPYWITAGPDGNLWFTESGGNRIGRITPQGIVTEFDIGITAKAGVWRIAAGPDGNLWFTESTANRIGRITPSGVVTEFSAGISVGASPYGITAGPDGNVWFTEFGGNRIGKVTLTTASNYQGLWWEAGGTEPGWAISVAHQGGVVLALWNTYDTAGKALWLSMLATEALGKDVFTGPIFITRGSPFDNFVGAGVPTVIGTGALTFADVYNGSFVYDLNGAPQTKTIARFDLATGRVPLCTYTTITPDFTAVTNYQDLWWAANGVEPGWGIYFAHQGSSIFATWDTYDSGGAPMWLSALLQRQGSSNVYAGPMTRTSGPRFDNYKAWDVVQPIPTVGTATVTFTSGNSATFNYTTNGSGGLPAGVNQTKAIARFPFGPTGGTVCQ
jgi:streptogramin lyase